MSKQTELAQVADTITVDSGNVGIEVTPSAWASGQGSIQFKDGGLSAWSNGALNGYIYSNAYYDGANSRYINNGSAGAYAINNATGAHVWFTAPSGTAGNAVSFSEAMRIDSSGNVGIGQTSNLHGNRLNIEKSDSPTDGPEIVFKNLYRSGSTTAAETGAIVFGSWRDIEATGSYTAAITGTNSAYPGTSGGLNFYTGGNATNDPSLIRNSNNIRMRIDSAGRVTKPSQPAFVAHTAPSTFTNGVDIIWSSTALNRGSVYNTSNGRFTAPVAGLYQFFASIRIENTIGTVSYHRISFRHNGSYVQSSRSQLSHRTATGYYSHSANDQAIYLNVNDYVNVTFETGGGASSFSTSAGSEHVFYGYLIG